jgi:hypothetical protein
MRTRFHIRLSYIFLLLAAFFFLFNGCGRKAPPKPPQEKQPPAVSDLSQRIDGDQLRLTWSVSNGTSSGGTGPAGFMIYKAKQKLSGSDCRNCPILFERVADISLSQSASMHLDGKTVRYFDRVEKGYRYLYKVIVYSKNGVMGKASNMIEFIY